MVSTKDYISTSEAFDAFGITHVSLSHIKTFAENRAQWYTRYILKERSGAAPAMFRGTSVEHGLSMLGAGAEPDVALAGVYTEYEKLLADAGLDPKSSEAGKERNELSRYFEQTKLVAKECGLLDEETVVVQQPINREQPYLVPSVGYVDFLGVDLVDDVQLANKPYELKTVGRMPSVPKLWDVQQVLLYLEALGLEEGVLMYATPIKYKAYTIRPGSNEILSMGVPCNISWYDSTVYGVGGFIASYLNANKGDVELAKEDMKWACAPDLQDFRWKKEADRLLADRIWNNGSNNT